LSGQRNLTTASPDRTGTTKTNLSQNQGHNHIKLISESCNGKIVLAVLHTAPRQEENYVACHGHGANCLSWDPNEKPKQIARKRQQIRMHGGSMYAISARVMTEGNQAEQHRRIGVLCKSEVCLLRETWRCKCKLK